jgi:hypothetical protein
MAFEELKADNIILDDASRSLLIIESTVPKLKFISDRGIKPRAVSEEKSGLWMIYLEPGVQFVTIMAEDYLDLELGRYNYQPRRARKIRVTAEQQKGFGTLYIETDPPGASITINDLPIPDKTPLNLNNQPTGIHFITIKKNGYGTLEESVIVEKDKTVTKQFTLEKLYAGLKVISDPSGATVYLDGILLGTTPLDRDDLSPGKRTISVEAKGYETQTQMVRLKRDEKPTITLFLAVQSASVIITTYPPGAEVFLDNIKIGNSPLDMSDLSSGDYHLTITRNGYDTIEQEITLNKGENKSETFFLIESNIKSSKIGKEYPKVKVYMKDGQVFTQRNAIIDSISLKVKINEQIQTYPLTQIYKIQAKKNRAGKWAIRGGAGCALLVMLATSTSGGDASSSSENLSASLALGVMSAGYSYLAGMLFDRWKTVYEEPDQSSR